MTHKEKTVITVETFQRTTMHLLRQKAMIAWCERCQAETMWLGPDEAAAHSKLTTREIFRLTEGGEIHFSESESGELLVCRDSCVNRLR